MHDVNRGRNLRELEGDLHSHVQRLVRLGEQQGDAVVFVGLGARNQHRAREVRENLLDLICT